PQEEPQMTRNGIIYKRRTSRPRAAASPYREPPASGRRCLPEEARSARGRQAEGRAPTKGRHRLNGREPPERGTSEGNPTQRAAGGVCPRGRAAPEGGRPRGGDRRKGDTAPTAARRPERGAG